MSKKRLVRSTTVLCVRRNGHVVMAGDGQVTLGEAVIKHTAKKIRRLYQDKILAGFAGSTADAFSLFSRFEAKLEQYHGNIGRGAVELAKDWRTDKFLRHLEALLLVSDKEQTFLLSGQGDVIEPDGGIAAIGSGGPYAQAAAQALAAELRVAGAASPVSVLDLAAGSGVWSIALAQASPNVSVTAVDWPGVLEVTERMTARFGVADRYKFVAEDLGLADFGHGHHVATLGHILHSEGEARSRELLKKTFAALAAGGTIAIQEFLVDEQRAKNTMGLIFAVNMLVATDDGDTFTFEEIAGWLREAGFVDVRQLDSPGPSPLILATKPS